MDASNHASLVLEAAPVSLDLRSGRMAGAPVQAIRRTLRDLAGSFANEAARAALPADRLVYHVQMWAPVAEATPGGLLYGVTVIEPGDVAGECFMTKGHFHTRRDTAEYYWTYQGEGVLLLMDAQRRCRAERMTPGSLHYIPGGVAHRTMNVGDAPLSFGACWPADAGHDYDIIASDGFSARVVREGGQVRVVSTPPGAPL